MRFVLFFIRFQVHVSIECTKKFYPGLQLFVRGHVALHETKAIADMFIGLK